MNYDYSPSIVLTIDEAKLLTMLLVEDRSHIMARLVPDLAPHGRKVLSSLITKLADQVLDVRFGDGK